jgi:hypothetical protein
MGKKNKAEGKAATESLADGYGKSVPDGISVCAVLLPFEPL